MTALMFGEEDRQLFGRYHHPASGHRSKIAAIVCPPIGEEAIRSYRSLKLLADRLAAEGVPTFRFDWFGTGDSAGDERDMTLATMIESLHMAHEEVMDMAAVPKIVWIGLRLGATCAIHAAKDAPPGFAGSVLWEPVTDISTAMQALSAAHRTLVSGTLGIEPHPDEALGFTLPLTLLREIDAQADTINQKLALKKTLWVGEGAPDHMVSLPDEDAGIWDSDRALNAYVIPTRTIGMIAESVLSW